MSHNPKVELLPEISLAKARFLAEQRWNRPLRAVFPQNPYTIKAFGRTAGEQLEINNLKQEI